MAICDTVRSQKRPVDRFKQVGTTDCCEPSWCLPKDVRQMDDPWMILLGFHGMKTQEEQAPETSKLQMIVHPK